MLNFHSINLRKLLMVAASLLAMSAQAQSARIAVTDLSYEEKVREYFHNVEFNGKRSTSAAMHDNHRSSNYSASGSASANMQDHVEVSFKSSQGSQTYIDRGELRKFTADIKGELLKSGHRLVQGKPWTQHDSEKLYDIIGRIKQGYYPGADYVLWGSINNVEFREDASPIQGTSSVSHSLSLELVGEFSLINTRTYEIKAAFSAMGEGSDTKIVNSPASQLTLNRSKVMQDVSRSLGEAVAREVAGQLGGSDRRSSQSISSRVEERVVIYK